MYSARKSVLFYSALLVSFILICAPADAAITNVYVVSQVTPDADGPSTDQDLIGPPGYITNDVFVTYDNRINTAGMYLTLGGGGTGTINQHIFGAAEIAPNPALIASFPNLAWDTFITTGADPVPGGLTNTTDNDTVVGLGYLGAKTFNATTLDVAWAPAPLPATPPPTGTPGSPINYLIARITLSDNATSVTPVTFAVDDLDSVGSYAIYNFSVAGGYLVPEPATMGLLAMGGIGLLVHRRRKRK